MQREANKKLNYTNYSLARNYTKHTKLNVQDSDGTLIINRGELDYNYRVIITGSNLNKNFNVLIK